MAIGCTLNSFLFFRSFETQCGQTTTLEQALGDSGMEKLPFDRMNPLAESGSVQPFAATSWGVRGRLFSTVEVINAND